MKTSEELCGISPQPDNTCPLIDEVKRAVDEADSLLLNAVDLLSHFRRMSWDDPEERNDHLMEILVYVQQAQDLTAQAINEDGLEGIRKRASEIRAWGQDWKDEAIRRIHVIDPELYDQIVDYREERLLAPIGGRVGREARHDQV
jgi:hypothetical protein